MRYTLWNTPHHIPLSLLWQLHQHINLQAQRQFNQLRRPWDIYLTWWPWPWTYDLDEPKFSSTVPPCQNLSLYVHLFGRETVTNGHTHRSRDRRCQNDYIRHIRDTGCNNTYSISPDRECIISIRCFLEVNQSEKQNELKNMETV